MNGGCAANAGETTTARRPTPPGFWIPAYAGMTVWGRNDWMPETSRMRKNMMVAGIAKPHTVIPAQAGIQNPGIPRRGERPGCGFPLSRE